MKTFQIMRTDHTVILTVCTPPGISPPHPKKPVAEGVIFKSGKVVINWLGDVTSVVVHDNIENVIKIHCNGDASLIQYGYDSKSVIEVGKFASGHNAINIPATYGYCAVPLGGTSSQAIGSNALPLGGTSSQAVGSNALPISGTSSQAVGVGLNLNYCKSCFGVGSWSNLKV